MLFKHFSNWLVSKLVFSSAKIANATVQNFGFGFYFPIHVPTGSSYDYTFFEYIDTWLRTTYGQGNVILSYVTREYVDPDTNPGDDPGFLQPDVERELSRRTSMNDDDFNENNKRVWLMLRAVTHKTDAWSIIKGLHLTYSTF